MEACYVCNWKTHTEHKICKICSDYFWGDILLEIKEELDSVPPDSIMEELLEQMAEELDDAKYLSKLMYEEFEEKYIFSEYEHFGIDENSSTCEDELEAAMGSS